MLLMLLLLVWRRIDAEVRGLGVGLGSSGRSVSGAVVVAHDLELDAVERKAVGSAQHGLGVGAAHKLDGGRARAPRVGQTLHRTRPALEQLAQRHLARTRRNVAHKDVPRSLLRKEEENKKTKPHTHTQ